MAQDEVRVVALVAEHRVDALGIGMDRPRLSWRVETAVPGWRQAASEIEVQDLSADQRFTSGQLEGDQSRLVPWPAPPLRSRQQVAVRVRVWGQDGSTSSWSDALHIEAALLDPTDWQAEWIRAAWPSDGTEPAPVFRTSFDASDVARARLYITACGVYHATLNGQACSEDVLAPGWTSYHHRLRYQVLDVTALVRPGRNELEVVVADGWYCGRLGWEGKRNRYGDHAALLAQLEVLDINGGSTSVATGVGWEVARSGVLASDLYDGETFDARRIADDWTPAILATPTVGRLEPPMGPAVRRTEELTPVAVLTPPSGRTILDFGQNLVGRLRFTVQAPAGTEIVLRHAEVLDAGELCTSTLRTAKATDRYIARGGSAETWEPQFTFHGFRYAEVEGWPGDVDPSAFVAVVCHTDMERTGTFACSDPRVERLHENAVWSLRGNAVDVPTDCPQRDERYGWTGDIQAFAPAATYLYDTGGFLASWLADLVADQDADGLVPLVVPSVMDENAAAAGWGDAAVLVPWTLYERLGDLDLLARHLPSMREWVDHVAQLAGASRLWATGFQFGDWLDPSAPNERPAEGRTDPYLVATAFFAHSAELVSRAAALVGDDAAAWHYRALSAEVRAAFRREYVTATGRVVSDSQTAYALVLAFGLLEDAELERRAAAQLRRLVRRAGFRIATGFLGTPVILDALCDAGYHDVAYGMLVQTDAPSWLYAVTLGATTIWERWDALRPDGTVNGEFMTSFNHYAFGAVADWLHRTVAGIAPLEPGYRRARIAPVPGGRLRWANGSLRTPYGRLESSWRIDRSTFELVVTVPPSATAEVVLPVGGGRHDVGAGEHRWTVDVPSQVLDRWLPVVSSATPIGVLRADAPAWKLLSDRFPDLERIPAGSELERTSVRDLFARFAPVDDDLLAALDRELAAL